MKVIFAILGLVAAALAQESSYTGPMFNPSDAAFFGPSSVVFPTPISDAPVYSTGAPAITTSSKTCTESSMADSILSSTFSRNATASQSSTQSSTLVSASRTASSALNSESASASVTGLPESTGAAVANYPGVMGFFAGGLVAGLAML
ncbi:hypothetical protein BDW02DRAFT_28675 [Decorospora gaudefroyi]|uniref:GPI anchored protein n=1 Tax=Decorospora gaudefroyi TaxID=184978 RepID=A0A6A5KEV7_9PLEO|nr:hypothetical protein BDW02DRAFT_28675 [Decorospora gaudefroyi]